MRRLLILYATHDGHTARIAHVAGDAAREAGWELDIWPCRDLPAEFSLAPYQAAIVAAPIIAGRYQPEIRRAVFAHRAALAAVPSAFVSASWGATQQPWAPKPLQRRQVNARFFRQTGWRPDRRIEVGGAVLYTRHTWPMRWLWSLFIRRTGGPHDLSRGYDFTDWDALRQDTRHFLTKLATPLATAS